MGKHNMSNTFDKLSVLDSFIEEVNSYLPEIETNLERLAQSPGDMDALEETYRRAHTIGGSASMMDFPGLAHVAHGMEDILGDALDGLTTLDDATLGLLRRSLSRLHQLLEGIRNGVDEEAVIAEDDEDYAQYRAKIEAVLNTQQQPVQHEGDRYVEAVSPASEVALPADTPAPLFDTPAPSMSAMPSFDEVLASFRIPTVAPGEDPDWPEDPAPSMPMQAVSPANIGPDNQRASFDDPAHAATSALDRLVASTRQVPAIPQPPLSPVPAFSVIPPVSPIPQPPVEPVSESAPQVRFEARTPVEQPDRHGEVPINLSPVPASSQVMNTTNQQLQELPQAYTTMQKDTQVLEGQVASLQQLTGQLRDAMAVIEAQRSEFKGFLDGSKDALDRMEEWAGRAMGLNLRNSPEQVRRLLPLSVMWVSNSKLKKVLELLTRLTSGVEVTDEQMKNALQQLQYSISSCGEAFQQLQQEAQAAQVLRTEPGWSPWEMRISRDTEQLQERVTFERRGDPEALRAEIEAQLRAELRNEYESRPATITTAMRAELEQQIRDEIRQEFEEKRRLQQRVSGPDSNEAIRELESRLRNEIEIQVRQEFLEQIQSNGGEITALRNALNVEPSAPMTTNFMDRAQEAAGITPGALPPSIAPSSQAPLATNRSVQSEVTTSIQPPAPETVRSTPTASQSSLASSATINDFGDEAVEIFRMEAEEHLQMISMNTAALEKSPTNRDLIQGIRRATHTLKGAAGMMGFRAIADLCHISEDLLDSIMEGNSSINSDVLSLILDTTETLDMLINNSRGAADDEARVQVLRGRYANLLGVQSAALHPTEEDLTEDEGPDDIPSSVGHVASVVADDQRPETNAQRAARGDLNVHVRLQKLDELVNLFGELLVNRSVLEERLQRLARLVADVTISSNRLRDVGQKLESRFEAATLPSGRSVQVMPGEGNQGFGSLNGPVKNGKNGQVPSHLEEFDELELDRYTEFHQLARGLSEGISDMSTLSTEMEAIIRECEGVFARENRLSTTFQDRLMKVRLVPLSTMTPRLYRSAKAVALKQHKEFEFLLEGEETEVDRTLYEEIAGPLLHLMRNAVNHGIETPEVRTRKGKSPVGQIKLAANYEGNQVVVTVSDDGSGLDHEHIRAVAIAKGLIRQDQPLSEEDLVDLIFHPGFSTAKELSEESGRGVGLDVVRDCVSRLRGTLIVESMPGHGTSFTMKFHTNLAIQSAMMVRLGAQQFAIPTATVETIGRLDSYKRTNLGGQPAVNLNNELYPIQALGQYLSLPVGMLDERAPLIFINNGGQRIALVVDEVKGKQDIVMKNLGPHLRQVHGIAGATVLGNGQVVLILELSQLLSAGARNAATAASNALAARRDAAPTASQGQLRQSVDVSTVRQVPGTQRPVPAPVARVERGRHVLVVDDSPSVRRVVSNMLKQHGWEVQMARDGVEALEMIGYETPAAVLLDIEMPRMDGYELIATVRAQEQYSTLPLVVLTSRAAAKHQQNAMKLGASAYVVKPYQDEELLNTLNALVYGAAVRL